MERVSIVAILLLGCASSVPGTAPDASTDPPVDARHVSMPDAGIEATCDPGTYASAITSAGVMTCGTVDAATAVAVRSRCSVYLGQHDSCGACNAVPDKWSESGPLSCSPGVGAGNACVSSVLDDPTTPVDLATVDLDGDVNDDDKLYATLHCITAARPQQPAPCAPGWAINGRQGGSWMCAPISEAAVGYVRNRCAVYLGWQDSCDGCTSIPTKWGHANDGSCVNGAGPGDTCTTATLNGEVVNLFGVDADGDVDGNDKLHLGLYCDPAVPEGGSSKTTCPDGQFVIATHDDGTFACGDPTAAFAAYVGDHCTMFFGWHDSCDACTEPPTKWGKFSTGTCANGAGTDDTCTEMSLGGANVQMFGLSPDGNVNGDDTLYVGLRCDP